MSSAIAPSGMRSTVRAPAASSRPAATTWSTGSSSSVFPASRRFAVSTRSRSTSDFPTGSPFASRNVYAIAPPIATVSARAASDSSTASLSDTFAPPRMHR